MTSEDESSPSGYAAPDPITKLDRSIKGHPNPASATAQAAAAFVDTPSITTPAGTSTSTQGRSSTNPPAQPKNPLDTHPTSPPTIYLNLLILEASFRKQYRKLHLRRRKYSFFLLLLSLWTSFFFHAVYIVGPSPYSAVSTFQKLGLLGGLVTGLLFWMSGLYTKTLVWPRRMVGNVNKGLRVFNVKLVVVRGGFWQRLEGWMEIVYMQHPLGWQYAVGWKKVPVKHQHIGTAAGHSSKIRRMSSTNTPSARKQLQNALSHRPPSPGHMPGTAGTPPLNTPPLSAAAAAIAQRTRPQSTAQIPNPYFEPDDYLPSGTHVKIVILAKGFSADFREGWELYRTEYWEKENERRIKEIEVIQHSITETGQLPPMTSTGIVMNAAPVSSSSSSSHSSRGHSHNSSAGVDSSIPGIRGRPARGASISKNIFENAVPPLRSHSRSSTSTPEAETEESSGSSSLEKGKIRQPKRGSGQQPLRESSTDTLTEDSRIGPAKTPVRKKK